MFATQENDGSHLTYHMVSLWFVTSDYKRSKQWGENHILWKVKSWIV